MSGTAIVSSHRCLDHLTGNGHPERPDRLKTIQHRLHQGSIGWMVDWIEAEPIDLSLVEAVHSPSYIKRLRQACADSELFIDTADCPISPVTFEVARISAGGAIAAVDAVMSGHRNAFCAVRPPGHHAERDQAMGFCFFNNIAVAAEYARSRYSLKRIAILDWDVHHGNGTQHHFESNPDVLFCSIHQDPASMYPGTGYETECGVGEGVGATLNVAVPAGSGDEEYRRAFGEKIVPALDSFAPELLFVSAGFDAHRADPLAHIQLNTAMFEWMTEQAMAIAKAHCRGKLVSVLEGGYNLGALADSVQTHVEALMG